MFDCIPFPNFTHTTGMTHFLEIGVIISDIALTCFHKPGMTNMNTVNTV